MTLKIKLYIAAGLAVLVLVIGSYVLSNYKISKLQKAADAAKQNADKAAAVADAKELEAGQYKQKTIYLEQKIAEIQAIARKQDEELEKFNINTAAARSDVERARRIRSITSTAGELCAKLAELGHPCE
ncbi:MAG: hypothetical protein H7070_15715 [Saprospiraceae bacterium]|nr:hypothetical protein [Pyrinomonadaceae bacterium]